MAFPSPGDLPNPGIEPGSPSLQADALPSEPPGKPKDLEELKKKQTENNTPEGINSRITKAEEQINDLEDRKVEMTATE